MVGTSICLSYFGLKKAIHPVCFCFVFPLKCGMFNAKCDSLMCEVNDKSLERG